MWISKLKWFALETTNAKLNEEIKHVQQQAHEKVLGLERMNARLQADLDWAKLRLNAVEKERAQLIAAAIGVKIAIPEFQHVDPDDHGKALHEMPDLSTVGQDAHDDGAPADPEAQAAGVDYSLLPGYRSNREG